MAPRKDGPTKKTMNRGAWTLEEDQKLAQCIQVHGAKKWKTVANNSGNNTLQVILLFTTYNFCNLKPK